MINKKGDISPVFKYIFIGIIGVILLTFFVRFAFKQVETSDKITEFTETRTLEDMLISFSISGETTIPANFYTKDKISLDPFNCDSLIVGNNRLKTSKIIFAPKELNSEFYIWGTDWKYPYRIGNIFYLADKETLFVLVGGSLAENLKGVKDPKTGRVNEGSIPDVFSVEYKKSVDSNYLTQVLEDYSRVRVIFIDTSNTLKNLENENLEVVEIKTKDCESENDMECRGALLQGNKQYFFFGKPLLYGAIFSSNYKCSYERAVEKFNVINKVYSGKAEELASKVSGCDYSLLKNLLLQKVTNPEEYLDRANNLDKENNRLRERDCETVF
ncbi:MAG: hypothetical protein PHG05_00115 [Candidatus Nanoarchaeia archaeon]|nr:hypothetical protein [Candidatus Nanoarchaeia archaeon]